MSDDRDPITEFDLVAYADGKLEPERAERVRLHIGESPELVAKVEAYLGQNSDLHAAFDALVREEVPPKLREALATTPRRSYSLWAARAAGIAALVAAGALTGWMLGRSSQASDFAADAFGRDATRIHMAASPPKAASTQVSDSAALRWLRQRISLELRAPDLSEEGYSLVGRYKVQLNTQPAVQLAYQADDGSRLSIFLRRRWRETQPQILTTGDGGRTVAYWLDGPITYGVTGNVETDRLMAIARKVNEAINIEPKVVPGEVDAPDEIVPSTAEAQGVRRGS